MSFSVYFWHRITARLVGSAINAWLGRALFLPGAEGGAAEEQAWDWLVFPLHGFAVVLLWALLLPLWSRVDYCGSFEW